MKLQVLVDKKLKETLKIQSPTFVGFFVLRERITLPHYPTIQNHLSQ